MRIKYYIKRAFELPPRETLKRGYIILSRPVKEKFKKFTHANYNGISDENLFTVLSDDINSKKELLSHFRQKENIFVKESAHSKSTEKFKKQCLRDAEKVLNHEFDLLGSGYVKVEKDLTAKGVEGNLYEADNINLKTVCHGYMPIDWQRDFKSGYRWKEKTYYKEIQYGDKKGVDIKVPWEMARCQHLSILGRAYLFTDNEKYAKEIVNQIKDFIINNPLRYGANWVCAMDVAIRIVNMTIAMEFIRQSKEIDDIFIADFYKSLMEHVLFIEENIEWNDDVTSNHYLSDISGLFIATALFGEINLFKDKAIFALKELETEIDKQVYDDGGDFESSVPYHRLVLELFFLPLFLTERINDFNFKENYKNKIKKMFFFLKGARLQNGNSVQFGDNDSGIYFKMGIREELNFKYLLDIGSVFFNEKDLKSGDEITEDVCWLFEKAEKKYLDFEENNNNESHYFKNSGIVILNNEDTSMALSVMPNGQNDFGGHAHNDKLSFELCIKEKDFFVDPGTYLYTPLPEKRNFFRSTDSHNTVMIDGEEQNEYIDGTLFMLKNDANAKCIEYEDNLFIGEHYGYKKLKKGSVIHRRKVLFADNQYQFSDEFSTSTDHLYKWNFILHSDVKIEKIEKNKVLLKNQDIKVLLCFKDSEIVLDVEDFLYSHGYGKITDTKKITAKVDRRGAFSVNFTIGEIVE